MTRDTDHHEKRRDERWETLKRRVQLLARLDGAVVCLAEGPHVVDIERVTDPDAITNELRTRGALSRATFERACALSRPPMLVTREILATAQRDLRALATPPAVALAREHRRALVRYAGDAGAIDEAWRKRKSAVLAEVAASASAYASASASAAAWFPLLLPLVAAVHGPSSAARLDDARLRLTSLGAERRRKARERIDALLLFLEDGTPPDDGDLAALAARLSRAQELPGRARARRVLDVLRKAADFAEAPASVVAPLVGPLRERSFEAAVREAGAAVVHALPLARDPAAIALALDVLAFYGLAFRIGEDGVPLRTAEDVKLASSKKSDVALFLAFDLTVAQALALVALPFKRYTLRRVAEWVSQGLELELLAEACKQGHVDALARAENARAARAYATWATKLVPHYKKLGLGFELSPELFTHLPKNEDVAILAVCLMEQARHSAKGKNAAPPDPIAVLDATLGVFQKLPQKASGILQRLRGTTPGAGRRAFPELAAWLDDDALLDRLVHVSRLAGATVALTKQLREDFEHASKSTREREHLEGLATRSPRQMARLEVLRAHDRSRDAAPRGRTKRRIQERIDELLPFAYRRELDAVFTEILREAWGIVVPALTPAWRDAVRFWLVVDDNRELLGKLLRKAASSPGAPLWHELPKNRAWLAKHATKARLSAWLAPRRREITVDDDGMTRTYVVALEEDPLEVLRMGIPFETCLALETGCNAASTVLNAIEANKRVVYVRTPEGKIVARKLIAISKELGIIGYNLYLAARGGATEQAIRTAVGAMCRELASDVGLPLANHGVPENLHDGFWYDDGTVAWSEDVDATAYCRGLELSPPEKSFEALVTAARGAAAMERGDVDAAAGVVTRWDGSPSNVALGAWIVERLGVRETARRATEHGALVPPLLRALARRGEDGMIEALALAPRLGDGDVRGIVASLLEAFPRSEKIARALADMTVRTMRVHHEPDDHSLAHVSLYAMPRLLDGLAASFDVLDEVDPAWLRFVLAVPSCGSCRTWALKRCARTVARIHAVERDDDVVRKALMSTHRSEASHRAALRIAKLHVLDGGLRALGRLAAVRPELDLDPAMLAARIRQSGGVVTDAIVAKHASPPPTAPPPYEELGPMLFEVDGIERVLPDESAWPPVPVEKWTPGPWELAWLRRRRRVQGRAELRTIALRVPKESLAMEKLALLADTTGIGEHLARRREGGTYDVGSGPVPAPALTWKSVDDCLAVAVELRRQVVAADRGVMPVESTKGGVFDRRLVDVALARADGASTAGAAGPTSAKQDANGGRDVVRIDPLSFLASAKDVLDRDVNVSWDDLLLGFAARADADAAALYRLVDEVLPTAKALAPETMAALWQHPSVRPALAKATTRHTDDDWCARLIACERAAARAGLDVSGLFEACALAMIEHADGATTAETETLDQLRTVIRLATTEASPDRAAALYEGLLDELSVSLFLRAVRKLPRDRAAAIREAGTRVKLLGDRGAARKAWLDGTRPVTPGEERSDARGERGERGERGKRSSKRSGLKKKGTSSIERG